MTFDAFRDYCLSFPGATEKVQWGHDLLFQVGGKTFVFAGFDAPWSFSIKCSDEEFAELIEREGIEPAPYLARNKWVLVKTLTTLPTKELQARIRNSYEMIASKLPKKVQASLK
jgi:predicted DNA-binding protein (MmcQ/YjbR family)